MDNLFTPEVIQQFLALLTAATDGGIKAVMLWLALPTLAVLIAATAWVYGIAYVVRKITAAYESRVRSNMEIELSKQKLPEVMSFGNLLINVDAEQELRALLQDMKSTAYVHASDVERVRAMLSAEKTVHKLCSSPSVYRALLSFLSNVDDKLSHKTLRDLEGVWNERKQGTKQDTEVAKTK